MIFVAILLGLFFLAMVFFSRGKRDKMRRWLLVAGIWWTMVIAASIWLFVLVTHWGRDAFP
jgi:hypothetical protein